MSIVESEHAAICPACENQSVIVSVLNRDDRMTCLNCRWINKP